MPITANSYIYAVFISQSICKEIGRLIMFKECLANNIVPFIIDEDLKWFYYRGLQEWEKTQGYLIDTCLTAQDRYKEILTYFKVDYSI